MTIWYKIFIIQHHKHHRNRITWLTNPAIHIPLTKRASKESLNTATIQVASPVVGNSPNPVKKSPWESAKLSHLKKNSKTDTIPENLMSPIIPGLIAKMDKKSTKLKLKKLLLKKHMIKSAKLTKWKSDKDECLNLACNKSLSLQLRKNLIYDFNHFFIIYLFLIRNNCFWQKKISYALHNYLKLKFNSMQDYSFAEEEIAEACH